MAKTRVDEPRVMPPDERPSPNGRSRALIDPCGLAREYLLDAGALVEGQSRNTIQPQTLADARKLVRLALELLA